MAAKRQRNQIWQRHEGDTRNAEENGREDVYHALLPQIDGREVRPQRPQPSRAALDVSVCRIAEIRRPQHAGYRLDQGYLPAEDDPKITARKRKATSVKRALLYPVYIAAPHQFLKTRR